MSASSSPNPMNLLLLGALGIGAYWFMTRSASAQPIIMRPATGNNAAANAGALGSLVGMATNLVRGLGGGGSVPLLGTVDGRAATQWDVTPTYGAPGAMYNNPSAYVSGGLDGIAANPVNASPWDYTQEYWY